MKLNNRKGFTLIELLAVIVILAIIALIAIPVIQDIVKHAKKEALRDTAYGLAEAGQNKCSSSSLKGTWDEMLVQFENNEEASEAKLSDYFNGKNPDAGEVSVNDSCKTAVAIWNDSVKTCAYKGYSDDKVALISMKNSNTCRLEASGDLDEDYVDTSSTGYKCSNPGSVVATEEKYFTFDQATGTITAYNVAGPKDVVIPCKIGGVEVKNVAANAFASKGLMTVLMPDSLVNIGSRAFQSNNLTSINLGSNLTEIGFAAFYANQLTNVVLPDSLKKMQNGDNVSPRYQGVFESNPLVSVTFGSNIEEIGDYTFYNVSTLTTADLSRANKLTRIGVNSFYGTKVNALVINTGASALAIQSSAFSNSKLISVEIKNTNVQIAAGSFTNNLIEELTLSGKVSSIGNDAFKNNQLSDADAFIMGRDASGNATTTLVSYAGANRSNITIPDNIISLSGASFSSLGITGTLNVGNGVSEIEDSKFATNSITNLIIGSKVTKIGNYSFSSNLLTNVTIGNGVTFIGSRAFQSNKISNLTLGSGLIEIGFSAFYNNQLTNVVLPDSLKKMYNGDNVSPRYQGVFESNPLVSVTFGSNIEEIGDYTFYNVSTLTNVDLSKSNKLTRIGVNSFSGTKVIELDVNTTSPLAIQGNAFYNSKLALVSINSSDVQIAAGAFTNNLIEELTLSGKVSSIGNDAFKNNQLPDADAFIMGRDASGNATTTLVSYAGANRSNITIPDNVTSLSGASFSSLGITGTLNVGNGVSEIEDSKFATNSITNLIIGSKVTKIGNYSFSSNLLTNVTIGNGVTFIGSRAFQSNKISNLTLGSGLIEIGFSAFYNNQLTNVVLPDSLKKMYNGDNVSPRYQGVFESNPLVSVTFGSNIEEIGDYTFYNVSTLTNVDLSKSNKLTRIGVNSFSGTKVIELDVNTTSPLAIQGNAFYNSRLALVSINSSDVQIAAGAFTNNLIEQLTLSGKVSSIGNDAFKNNQLPDAEAFIMGRDASGNVTTTLVSYAGANRSNITIPDNVVSLSGASFSSLGITGTLNVGNGVSEIEDSKFATNSITNLIIGSKVTKIGNYSFSSNLLTNVTIGNGVTFIGSRAFQSNKISNLILGNGLIEIGFSAFYNNQLTNVVLPDSLKKIYNGDNVSPRYQGAFESNPLTSITFGSGIEDIGDYSFYNVSTLTNVDLSRTNALSRIGSYSFYGTRITSIEIPASVQTIGSSAFASNSSLATIYVKGKVDASSFTSVGGSWNGSCNNIIYEISSCYVYSGNTITGYQSYCSKNVNIPSTLGGNTITSIASDAFKDLPLTGVTIPSTVTTIGSDVFSGTNVDYIAILGKESADNFTTLGTNWDGGNHAIYENDQTTCLKTSGTIVNGYYIGASICNRNVIIPNTITSIADNSFNDTLYNSITVRTGARISSFGTNWNGTIYKVTFEGDSYDYNCFTLNGSTITGYKRFCNANVDLSSNAVQGTTITAIGDNAFKNSAITGITLGSNITSVGLSAFEGNNIENISLVNGLVNIGNRAFNNIGLTTLSIPSTVMTIGDNAFDGNNMLTSITVEGKTSSAGFTSLGTSWNGTCNHIVYNG